MFPHPRVRRQRLKYVDAFADLPWLEILFKTPSTNNMSHCLGPQSSSGLIPTAVFPHKQVCKTVSVAMIGQLMGPPNRLEIESVFLQ